MSVSQPAQPIAANSVTRKEMGRHCAAVQQVAESVRGFYERKEPYRIHHGSTNSTRPKDSLRAVDISSLGHVLAVNKVKRTILVEPNVAMDTLVEATLPHGLVPPVVMEFPGITAGGGFSGTGGESSSFRHGFFDETVERVEMVLANGEIVTASRDERPDLFRLAPGAMGTLGIVTMLEINLIPAKKYVHLHYHRFSSVTEAVKLIREETTKPVNDFVDGILYSKDYGVIITGTMTDEKPDNVRLQTFSGAWDPWFYLHVGERILRATACASSMPKEDYIPLAEYLFRYDRGAFWCGRVLCMYWLLPFTRFSRWLLDDLMHTRMIYRGLDTRPDNTFTVQDIAMPFENAEMFIDYLNENHPIWPLWLCPLKRRAPPTFHPYTTRRGTKLPPIPSGKLALPGTAASAPPDQQQHGEEDEMMLNIGVWGHEGTFDPPTFVAKTRAMEDKVCSLGGAKWLYAHVYRPEDKFWEAYGGRAWYDALRAKYHASALPSVYDKVRVRWDVTAQGKLVARPGTQSRFAWLKSYWPIGGIWSAAVAYASGDMARHRNAAWQWQGEK